MMMRIMNHGRSLIGSSVLALSFLSSTVAMAGVVFVPPPPASAPVSGEEADYPESHFGSSGAMVGGRGYSEGFAAREVNQMEAPDEETGRAARSSNRGIASVGANPNSGVVSDTQLTTSQAAAVQDIPQSVVSRKGVQEVSVIASDLGYFPKTIFVSRDVPVRMFVTGASKNTLCIMMDSFQVRKQVKSQKIEEITFLPNLPGKYRFYCPVNGMEGNLVVKELSSYAQQEEMTPSYPITSSPVRMTPESSRRMPASVKQGE